MIHEMMVERSIGGREVEIAVQVQYALHPAVKGARDGPGGPPLEPDEPACIDVQQAWDDETGHELILTNAEMERAVEEIAIDIESMADNQREERAQRQQEQRDEQIGKRYE